MKSPLKYHVYSIKLRAVGVSVTLSLMLLWSIVETGCAREQLQPECGFAPPCEPPVVDNVVEKTVEPEPFLCRKKEPELKNIPNVWPVAYYTRISSVFKNWRRGRRAHKGIDLEAPSGTPVLAAAEGEVVFSGRDGAYGNIIVIDHHNGYKTAYAHLKKCQVKKGDHVVCEQQIGLVGITGNATANHLHYEVRYQGVPTDPKPFLPQQDGKKVKGRR